MKTNSLGVAMLGLILILTPVPVANGSQSSSWTYTTDTDPLTDKVINFALIRSTNSVQFSSPYEGPQRAFLLFQKHPRFGHNAVFGIERGQSSCPSLEKCLPADTRLECVVTVLSECTVLVRFDEGTVTRWRVTEPLGGPTTVQLQHGAPRAEVFIDESEAFVARLRKAKSVRIATRFMQEGEQVFNFNVAGLVW